MFKKAQAAMEFLMTYGWAILVVLAAIGALAYFGVLDTASLLPERCAFPAGVDCVGKALISTSGNYVDFVLQNSHGAAITLLQTGSATDDCTFADIKSCAGISCSPLAQNSSVSNNQKVTIRVNCTSITVGRFKSDITINYMDSNTGLTLQSQGSIRGKAV
ncbi:MAG: hypothetical protein ABIC91_00035 [Nanoarchaeota archaeon]|nr:hypothetical protein [Nanoarchaeota archaeon]MBU1029601.1 hypothetical protein [Nanoarchaeota archaeon]MBU1850103.1 hypothetical protein [Nanoarchaeota archaeon]